MGRIEIRAGYAPSLALGLFALCVIPGIIFVPDVGAKVVFAVLLVIIAALAYVLGARRLWVDDAGVTTKGVFGEKHVAWNDVEYYTFWSTDQQAGAAAAAGAQGGVIGVAVAAIIIGIVRSRRRSTNSLVRPFSIGRLTLVTGGRKKISIDSRYRHAAPVLERAFSELHPRLRANGSRQFTPFALGDTELVHKKKGTLALAEIEKITATGSRVVVKKRDKRLGWANVALRDVRNGLLFLEELAERGISVSTSQAMYVPPSILQKLLDAASRQAALPQARVVQR